MNYIFFQFSDIPNLMNKPIIGSFIWLTTQLIKRTHYTKDRTKIQPISGTYGFSPSYHKCIWQWALMNANFMLSSFKRPLEDLWRYLEQRGKNTRKLWEDIKAIVFKTIAAAVSKMASLVMHHVTCRESVHELFGFDILLDSKLRPWLLEVNISPRSIF